MTTTGLPPVPSRVDLLLTITALRGARRRATDPNGPGYNYIDYKRCVAGHLKAAARDLGSAAPKIALPIVADALGCWPEPNRRLAKLDGAGFWPISDACSDARSAADAVEFYDRALAVLEAQLALATADEPAETPA
jgi:hypothetical protein